MKCGIAPRVGSLRGWKVKGLQGSGTGATRYKASGDRLKKRPVSRPQKTQRKDPNELAKNFGGSIPVRMSVKPAARAKFKPNPRR